MGNAVESVGRQVMDQALERLAAGQVSLGLCELADQLTDLRASLSPSAWACFCESEAPTHPLWDVLREEPITRHAAARPRGYPGDAELIDLIYGLGPKPQCSEFGQEMYDYVWQSESPRAVRERCHTAAALVTDACHKRRGARILSVGCGHARELHQSGVLEDGRLGCFVGIDHDSRTLQTLRNTFGDSRVLASHASVRVLLNHSVQHRDMDLVYAVGLFDYLCDRTGRALARVLFGMLRSGGHLVIANFTPGSREVGYMETFMRWHLVYRTPEQMQMLADDLPHATVAPVELTSDATGRLCFLHIWRG